MPLYSNVCVKKLLLRCTILLASVSGFGYVLVVRSASGRCLLGRFLPKLSRPQKGRLFFVLLPLAGCAYDPHWRPGPDLTDASAYSKDIADCREKAATDADQVTIRHGYTWAIYWIYYPLEKRHQLRLCLADKGYEAPK
jgi:hypothetical protein